MNEDLESGFVSVYCSDTKSEILDCQAGDCDCYGNDCVCVDCNYNASF